MKRLAAHVLRTSGTGLALVLGTALHAAKPRVAHQAQAAAPLTQRERVEQLLDRFTFGARPGELDQVLALGADQWLDQQLNPDAIPDPVLQKRLADYPALTMTAAQTITAFPERRQIEAVADGKTPYPTDPLLKALYEVQVYKLTQEKLTQERDQQQQTSDAAHPQPEPSDADKAAQKKQDQEAAARVAGELFALPRNQRMTALIAMPVEDRVLVSTPQNFGGDQRAQLLAEFTPRERELFNAMGSQFNSIGGVATELEQARILRDVLTERQLQAVMTNFWMNHFNVFLPKDSDRWYTTSFERDVIRPHALGSFRDLLLATAESPAMMVYLDNHLSIGPNSQANGVNAKNPNAKRGNRGLNENYGREVMELHTVGVNGGYTQADVTALAAILTGWGVDHPEQGGPFAFDPRRHEPGAKIWLGYRIDDEGNVTPAPSGAGAVSAVVPGDAVATANSMKQGIAALNILADSPHTAHFISYLLAQYFVADDPPAALVDRLQGVYLSSHGDIRTILRALIASPEFNSRQYFRNKVKTPEEFVASAFRTTGTDPQNLGALANTLRTMGMPLYRALPPTGYYLTAKQWMNSGALVDRLNFAYQLTNGKLANQKFDAPKLVALGLLTPASSNELMAEVTQPGAQSAKSRPAAGASAAARASLVGVAATPRPAAGTPQAATDTPPAGTSVAVRLLETTMIGAPASARTNELIFQQVQQLRADSNPMDTLNTLAALVMGSPEFQVR